MATICLISCNLTEEPYPVFPLGMSMVAEAARNCGHTVKEWDLLVHGFNEKEIGNFLAMSRPDFIGLSLRNVDNVNYNMPVSYIVEYTRMVQMIRKHSAAPIILGGSAFSIFPELLLERLGADYGIAGEGEDLFCDLIGKLENKQPGSEKILRNNPFQPPASLTCKSHNPELARYYLANGGMLNIQTKRGCPHHCIYCTYPILEGHQYRYRPVEAVTDEIKMLIEIHHADYLAITDSVFNDARDHYLEIAEAMIRRNIKINWMCFLRPQRFKAADVDLLKRSGLKAVEWGTDAADDQTLAQMGKSFDWATVAESNAIFARVGIANAHFIIFGGPGENTKTFQRGLDHLSQLADCVVFASIGIRVFPNTILHKSLIEDGWPQEGQALLEPRFYFSPEIDVKKIHQQLLDAFAGRRDRIYPDGQQVERIRALHHLGYRGPLWDLLMAKPGSRRRGE